MDPQQLYINGEFVTPHASATLEVVDPATTEVIGRVPDSDGVDVDRAVRAARAAFDEGPWKDATAQDRGRVLFKLAEFVRSRADELAEIETRNTGKPIVEAEFDIADVATCFEYYGGLATKIHGDVIPVPDNAMSLALREPIGVAALIVPWNYPLLMASWKLAPAICAGCTAVLKPAEQTPLSVLALASSFNDAGLPPGVVNIVTGLGEHAGAGLVEHTGVDKIAFTGSNEVGKAIMRGAAGTLKKISLELGGKSPNIFFADSDFEIAVEGALFGVFFNQGEVCSAGSRILVQRPIYKKFVEAMVEKAKTIKLGPGMDRDTKMGPMISAEHFERVRGYQEIGKREATLALGGSAATGARLGRGYFIQPTIFSDVSNDARIAREEIFGPVASVIPFDDERDAMKIANDTYYGLAAAVWTRDIFRAMRVVKNLRAGIVWVNHMQPTYVEAPWGGYKQSGVGRELGKWGVDEYLNVKQVYINLSEQPIGWETSVQPKETVNMNYYGGKELAAAFRTVRGNTIKLAEEIPEDKYGFRASPETKTAGQLLVHIALSTSFARNIHGNNVTDMKTVNFGELMHKFGAEEAKPRNKAETLAFLRTEGDAFAAYLDGLSDAFLAEKVTMMPGQDPAAKTRFEMLLSPKEHEMHHRGQLMLVQRMIGQVPHLTRQSQERMAAMQAAAASR